MAGLVIKVKYDASVASCPHESQFKAAVAGVVKYYETHFNDPITINIHVGWGEVDGERIGNGDGAESISNYTANRFTYSQIKAALTRDATSANDHTALASLTSNPTHGGTFSMTRGEAKALGLLNATSTAIDGWTGVDATTHWVYNTTNTSGSNVTGSECDLFSFFAHEISEIMGRQMDFGVGSGDTVAGDGYYPMDLFDYSTRTGARSFNPNAARYFSFDGGHTHIHSFNTDPGGDQFDWASGKVPDSYDAFGSVGAVSAGDLRLLDVLGYNAITSATAVASNAAPRGGSSIHAGAAALADDLLAHNGLAAPDARHAILAVNEHGAVTYHAGESYIAHVMTHVGLHPIGDLV